MNWEDADRAVTMDLPNASRMYDYLLGGAYNFPADREAAEQVLAIFPDVRHIAWANRSFLRRAVSLMLAEGIDQFLDVGSGLATAGNVHELVQGANPEARIAYVDVDPIAVHMNSAILEDNALAVAIQADASRPGAILDQPRVRALLDFERPIGLLLLTVLHFITDDAEAYASVQTLRAALAPGSYVAISHGTYDDDTHQVAEDVEQLTASTANPYRSRTRQQVERFFDGCSLVDPGLVYGPAWRPEGDGEILIAHPERSSFLAGVGRVS